MGPHRHRRSARLGAVVSLHPGCRGLAEGNVNGYFPTLPLPGRHLKPCPEKSVCLRSRSSTPWANPRSTCLPTSPPPPPSSVCQRVVAAWHSFSLPCPPQCVRQLSSFFCPLSPSRRLSRRTHEPLPPVFLAIGSHSPLTADATRKPIPSSPQVDRPKQKQ